MQGIDFDTDDELVEAYVKSSREHLEMWSQLSFGVKTNEVNRRLVCLSNIN